MSRRKKGSFAQEFIQNDLKNELTKLLTNRRVIRTPFPVDPMDIYQAIWSPDERVAIRILKPYGPKMFDLRESIHINKIKWKDAEYRIVVKLPEPLPSNGDFWCEVDFASLPRSMMQSIATWIPPWLELEVEKTQMLGKLQSLSEHCKTFGQMYRVWPDLINLLDRQGQAVIERARAKSRLPDSLLRYNREKDEYEIDEAFRPEAFASFVMPIAEALMLPLDENVVEVASITRVR